MVDRQCAVANPISQEDFSDEESSVASVYEELKDESVESVESLSDKAVFNGFKAWLMSLDGGKKKERDASLHAAQLKRILQYVDTEDPTGSNILALFNSKVLNEKWLCLFQKEKKPGTVKAYLHSLLHFCDFAAENQAMFDIEQELIRKVRSKVSYWSKAIRKDVTKKEMVKERGIP